MTTALQKYDIGRVFPTPDALVLLLGDGFASWIARHTDARPTNGSTKLALSGGIYDEIHSLSNSLNILDGSIADRIAAAIGAELDAGGSVAGAITSAIQTLLDGPLATIQTTLTNQGVDIAGFLTDIATTVDAEVTDRMSRFPDLGIMQTTLESIQNLDLIKHLLAHDDDGEVVLDKIVIREVKTNPDQHRVLNLCEDGALNKEYYCITGDESSMTIVLPDSGLTADGHNKVSDGDSVYIEYRSTGNGPAPVAAILSESQYNAAGGDAATSILFGVLTSDTDGDATDNGLDMGAMYTRIRATYCYGKWMAEVVQFTDADQEEAAKHTVSYRSGYAGSPFTDFDVQDILEGSYQLAGGQASYCGMIHSGWKFDRNSSRADFALGETIVLDADKTLYAHYTPHTQTLVVSSATANELRHSAYRAGESGIYGPAPFAICNESAFHSAIAGWRENIIRLLISFWWYTVGGRPNDTTAWVWARIGESVHRLDNLAASWPMTNEPNAFTVTLQRDDPQSAFVLPTVTTAASEGAVIPYISGIIFE